VAERHWIVDATPVEYECVVEQLRACLDTLIENAVRYTERGDAVRLLARSTGDRVVIGVADSGPGLSEELLRAVASGRLPDPGSASARRVSDPRARTGLGLALLQEVALARGGGVAAGRSAEGGALVVLTVPRKVTAIGVPVVADDTGESAPGPVPAQRRRRVPTQPPAPSSRRRHVTRP
jgi:signal transduction histidine kinase